MGHSLIFGMTESGKTTLAKQMAQSYKKRGMSVIVLDPLHDPDWQADFKTDDSDVFLNILWKSRGCAVFIDEAGDAVGKYDTAMIKTATRGRHWGHVCHYISQRGTMLARTVRDQCSDLFLFCTASEDCKQHALEWNNPSLIEGSKLNRGEFFHCSRFSKDGAPAHAERCKVF